MSEYRAQMIVRGLEALKSFCFVYLKRFAGRSSIVAAISVLSLAIIVSAGSLTPLGAPGSTMYRLSTIWGTIASDSYDSSAIIANQNGSLFENLKYIESQLGWASSSSNLYYLGSGNVGIGDSTPEAKFEVVGTASVSALYVGGSSWGWPLEAPAGSITSPSFAFDGADGMGVLRSTTTMVLQSKNATPDLLGRSRLSLGEEFFSLTAVRSEDAAHSGSLQCYDEAGPAVICRFDVIDAAGTGTTQFLSSRISFGTGASMSGNFDPGADSTHDLGSSANRWRELYVASGSIHIGTAGDEAVIDYNVNDDYLSFKPDGSTSTFRVADTPIAGAGGGLVSIINTLNAMDSGDTIRGLFVDLTNGAHTGGSLRGIDVDTISGGSATERAIHIGTGWDRHFYVATNAAMGAEGRYYFYPNDATTPVITFQGNPGSSEAILYTAGDFSGTNSPTGIRFQPTNFTAMNGSDTMRALWVNLSASSPNHAGAGNTLYGVDVNSITGDEDATEIGLHVGSGWDLGAFIEANASISGNFETDAHAAIGSGADVNVGGYWSTFAVPEVNLLSVAETITDVAGDPNVDGISNTLTLELASDPGFAYFNGVENVINLTSANAFGIDSAIGAVNAVFNQSDETVDVAYGALNKISNTGTSGSVTTAYGSFAAVDHNAAGGSITDAYVLYADGPVGGPTTNRYGLFVENQGGAGVTNGWNIYSDGATSRNYFAGHASVGGNLELGTPLISQGLASPTVRRPIFQLNRTNYSAGTGAHTAMMVQGIASGSDNAPTAGWFLSQISPSNTNTFTGTLSSMYVVAEHLGTGPLTEAVALNAYTYDRGSGGTTTTAIGVRSQAATLGTGTAVTNAIAFHARNSFGTGNASISIGFWANRSVVSGATLGTDVGLLVDNMAGGTNNVGILISSGSSTLGPPVVSPPSGNWGIYNDSVRDNFFNSNLGIGTNTISATLEVAGTASISGLTVFGSNASIGGNLEVVGIASISGGVHLTGLTGASPGEDYVCRDSATGEITYGSSCVPSSIRFKENVQNLEHGLDWLAELRPVTFDWKHNGSESLGFIAEEVEQVSPLLALYQDGEVFSVNYQIMTAVLAKAIQEQQAMIEALQGAMSAPTIPLFAESDSTVLDRIVALFSDLLGIEFGEGSVSVEKLCVGSVCVTEEEFMKVFGAGTQQPDETTDDVVADEDVTPGEEVPASDATEESPEALPAEEDGDTAAEDADGDPQDIGESEEPADGGTTETTTEQ